MDTKGCKKYQPEDSIHHDYAIGQLGVSTYNSRLPFRIEFVKMHVARHFRRYGLIIIIITIVAKIHGTATTLQRFEITSDRGRRWLIIPSSTRYDNNCYSFVIEVTKVLKESRLLC